MKNLKKIIFTMIFVSVISLIGISSVKADNTDYIPGWELYWGNNNDNIKVKSGQFYNNAGSLVELFYPNYYDFGVSPNCPYLNEGPLGYPAGPFCFVGSDDFTLPDSTYFRNINQTVDQASGLPASVHNLFLTLQPRDYMTPGDTYLITLYFGIARSEWEYFAPFLATASNFAAGYGTASNIDVRCFLSNDSESRFTDDYCQLSYVFTAGSSFNDVIFIDFQYANRNYDQTWGKLNWIIYPRVMENPVANLRKYTFNKGQLVFISGIESGEVYISQDFGNFNQRDYSYASYYDNDAYPQPYDNYIYNYSFYNLFNDQESYLVYYFDLVNNLDNAESLLLSLNSWYTFDSEAPYQSVDFYVSKDAYVDIVTPITSTFTYNYKNPVSGVITPIVIDNGSFIVGQSTLFDNISSGLVYFTPSVLVLGNVFNNFFTSLNTPLSTFLILSFSIGAMLLLIKLFM